MNGPGFTIRQVVVDEMVPSRGVAVVREATTRKKFEVPVLPMRVRLPAVGERWLLDRTFGFWSFAALLTSETAFAGSGTDAEEVNALIQAALEGLATGYDVAVANGFTGTQAQWLASLEGEDSTVPGPPGPPNTLTLGTVTTVAPGSPASASITGSAPSQTLSLGIPKGDKGDPGDDSIVPGPQGKSAYQVAVDGGFVGTEAQWLASLEGADSTVPGPPGPGNSLSVGTVTTGAPGSAAAASVTGASPNQSLNLTIPRGDKGDPGEDGTFAHVGDTPPPGDPSTWVIGQVWVDTGTVLG